MTQQLAALDAAEITTWLTHITHTVDRGLREPARSAALAGLIEGLDAKKLGMPVLAPLAFLADCLRVAHLAILADGKAEDWELERVTDLVRIASAKYFLALPSYDSFGDGVAETREVARFLRTHREDTGPYGFSRSEEWRGLSLARQVERSTRNSAPLREHERMLVRVMDAVFAERATDVERAARRRLRDLFEQPTTAAVDVDPRATAFCRSDGPEVFASVSHGSHFHERDPFDVEMIHAEARAVFHHLVDRATSPEQARQGNGRTLLVLGESGAGKTHLLRALRSQVHGRRQGYVGYLQMTAKVDDYTRYVLRSLIDSLERPYDAPSLSESGLMYLSDGLVEWRDSVTPDELEQLRTAEMAPAELERLINRIVDRVLRIEELSGLESDLVHALCLLQRRDPALQRRIIRFLRCDTLTNYDRELLGLVGREKADDPQRTIRELALLMHELQLAALVLVVDQIEDAIPDGTTVLQLQQALDGLRGIADAAPTCVIVVACLQDVYDAISPKLSRTLIDRLEQDPPPVRLASQRQPDEIEEMLVRRLEHLYSFFDVPWREDDPLYPYTPAQIASVSQLRTRDCLSRFRDVHNACIAARRIVHAAPAASAPAAPPPPDRGLDQQWEQLLAASGASPDDEAQLLSLVADAIRGAAAERGIAIDVRTDPAGLVVESKTLARRVVAVCNNPPQRGSFGNQLTGLRAAATKLSARPIALRSGDFKFTPKSKMAQYVGELVAANGMAVPLAEAELRVMCAMRAMASTGSPGLAEWRKAKQPLGELASIRQVLELDPVEGATVMETPATASPPPAAPRPRAPTAETKTSSTTARGSSPSIIDPLAVRLGVVDSMRADPIVLPLEEIKTHVAFLGSTGSGKTTAALCVIEQLLERGVSVLLVDRKGDLAQYVKEGWWNDPDATDRERRRSLRERIEVALYTPGNPSGRPLRLPLVPSLSDAKPHDREQIARYAADGLGAMIGYGKSASHKAKASILQCAIALHGNEREISLDLLLETINRPDPELLHGVGSLQRHFASLSEDLQTLLIQRGTLLSGEGELLDIEALLPPVGSKPRLSIINTAALTEIPVLQFWISRLIVELARLGRRRPSSTLQGVAFFDEADMYIPATSSPATKDPMFDLLRRSRSTGIGVLLATQNPGDLDYKGRDNIITWLLGKISQDRAIEKMRNLIANYPDVGARLASQRTGSFFLLSGTQKRELRAERSMMETVQLAESEVAELARQTRDLRP